MNEKQIAAMRRTLRDVEAERIFQHSKYGEQNRTPEEFGAILMEEVGEFFKDANDLRYGGKCDKTPHARRIAMRDELIQVAAMAVQMVECIEREIEANK